MDVAEAANELEDEEVTSVLSSMRIVEPDQYYLSEIVPVRLVGECVKWNVRAKGLEFHQQPPSTSNEGWWEYRLCCRLQGDRIDFQVVSSQLGFRWRCFPTASADFRGAQRTMWWSLWAATTTAMVATLACRRHPSQ